MSREIALKRIKSAQENKDTILDLSNLGLKEIPSEISELSQLTHLYLENNQIIEINDLEQLKQLKLLSLVGNQLSEIPDFLLNLGISLIWKNVPISSNLVRAIAIAVSRAQEIARLLDIIRVKTRTRGRRRVVGW